QAAGHRRTRGPAPKQPPATPPPQPPNPSTPRTPTPSRQATDPEPAGRRWNRKAPPMRTKRRGKPSDWRDPRHSWTPPRRPRTGRERQLGQRTVRGKLQKEKASTASQEPKRGGGR